MRCAQQVLAALKARYIAAATAAGDRVYTDRLFPLTEEKVPALRLYVQQEDISPETVHFPVLQKHELTIGVEHCDRAVSGIDDVIAALQLETALAVFDTLPHATLGINGLQLTERGSGPLLPIEGADVQIAQRTTQLNAQYRTFANAPEAFA
jgi:hypothetical protein